MTKEQQLAVQWLESLDEEEHERHFGPVGNNHDLFSLKRDDYLTDDDGDCLCQDPGYRYTLHGTQHTPGVIDYIWTAEAWGRAPAFGPHEKWMVW